MSPSSLRRSRGRVALPAILVQMAVLATTALVKPATAQQVPNAAPGVRPEGIYDVNGLDNVSLMNGALSIRLPLGLSYPINGGLSYQLGLAYNSTLWDNRTDPCPDPCDDFIRFEPKVQNNAGLGWRLSLGELIPPSSYWNQSFHWTYVSPDGSEHVLYDRLHISDPEDSGDAGVVPANQTTLYTRDGSYIRARRSSSSSNTWRLEMPNGQTRVFEKSGSDWRLARLEDRFGNELEVSYSSGGLVWTLDDGHRTHTVTFLDVSATYPNQPRILSSVELSKFGGGKATYTFEYSEVTVARPGAHTAGPLQMQAQVLQRVVMPESLTYDMGEPTAPAYDGNGLITQLRVPTNGKIEWEWENLIFPHFRKVPSNQESDPEPWRAVWGVKKRKERTETGAIAAVWEYTRSFDHPDPLPGDPGPLPEKLTVTLTDPYQDYTRHFFSVYPAIDGLYSPQWGTKLAEYGMPYTRQTKDTAYGIGGEERYLSSESWECDNAGNNCSKKRSTFVAYELDDISPVDDETGKIFNKNRRLRSQSTIYHDDGDRYRAQAFSDFDGLGHYRESETWSNFGPTKRSETTYNPGVGSYVPGGGSFTQLSPGDPWILRTFESRTLSQETGTGPSAVTTSSKEEFCFDIGTSNATGALERHRVLQSRAASPFRASTDLLRVLEVASNGNVIREDLYGGDAVGGGANIGTGSNVCGLSLPQGNPTYRTRNTYQYGTLKTSNGVDPEANDEVVLSLVDRTISQATGLPFRSEDPAGFGFTYNFDELGRLVAEKADNNVIASVGHEYPDPFFDAGNTARTGYLRTGCAQGPNEHGHCNNDALRLSTDYWEFDGLGRLIRKARRMPIVGDEGTGQGYTMERDRLGRQKSQSTWFTQAVGNPVGETTWTGFDRFGRPATITQPDGSQVEMSYQGDRVVSRKVQVATGHSTTSALWSTEIHDALGRLVEVCDGATSSWGGSCNAQRTLYSYDEKDRLIRVCQNAAGSSCGQVRTFGYDGRGFLVHEIHPELGPGGNGTVDYRYDARGNAVKKEIRPNNGTDHPLRYEYDPAGRLIRVEENPDTENTWKVLKEFFYGRKNAGNDLRAGKLVMAKRTNWLKVLEPLDPLADPEEQPIVVSDHFTYTEPGGRLSRKRTSITVGPGTSSWTSQFTYDKLGNLRTIRYPECQGWPCRSGRPDPERLVAFDYREGFLTDIGNYSAQENPSAEALSTFSDGAYASAIEYQLGGMLHEISYGNGVKWSQSVAPNHMSRPHQITTSGLAPIPPSPTPGNNTEPEANEPQSANWSTGTYGYDAAGNISKIGDFSYQYDAFHRLKEEEESFFPRQSAIYDPYGNLTQLTTLTAVESMPTDTSTNRLVGASYDDAGNLTSITLGQEQHFDYDGVGMLKTQQTPTGVRAYLYDASDERVMRWDCPLDECGPDTSKEHITIRGLNGEVLRVYEGTERADRKWKEDTIYRDGQPLIRIQDGGQGTQKLHALHHDHLGSMRQVTNWLGKEVSRHRYYPFGKEATPVASSDPAHKFTGHERDEGFQSGEPLDYMHARYCSPVLGRFLSVDPVNGSPSAPQGWNRFAYVRNNPLRYVDPAGETAAEVARSAQEFIDDVKQASTSALSDGSILGIAAATAAGSLLDVASGLVEPLRVGEATGSALGRSANGLDIGLAIVGDSLRGSGLVAPVVGGIRSAATKVAARRADNALDDGVAAVSGLTRSKQPAVVVGASNRRTGETVLGRSRPGKSGCCAEADAAQQLGGRSRDIVFSRPVRPRTGESIPVCTNCQQQFGKRQFPKGTRFEGN